jgi:hypothetical protein
MRDLEGCSLCGFCRMFTFQPAYRRAPFIEIRSVILRFPRWPGGTKVRPGERDSYASRSINQYCIDQARQPCLVRQFWDGRASEAVRGVIVANRVPLDARYC